MAGQNDFCLEFRGARNGVVEIVHFKPQEHSVAGFNFRIADAAVMIGTVPVVQLKNEPAVCDEPLVIRPAMIAATAEQLLVPAAAGFHIVRANQGLWTHSFEII